MSEIIDFKSRKRDNGGGGLPPISEDDLDLQLHIVKQVDSLKLLADNGDITAIALCVVLKGGEVMYPSIMYNHLGHALLLEKVIAEAGDAVRGMNSLELFGSGLEEE